MSLLDDIHELYEKPPPALLVSLNGHEADLRMRSKISNIIESLTRNYNGSGIETKRLNIILSSIVGKLAEGISLREMGVAEKSERYYEMALRKLKDKLETDENYLLSFYRRWLDDATEFWKEKSKYCPIQECIFLFCERYQIDLIELQEHFSFILE